MKGVCLRVVSNSKFETWSQLYQSSELYQKSEMKQRPEPSYQNSETRQKSEVEKHIVDSVVSERQPLMEDAIPTNCRNEAEKNCHNGGRKKKCDYYNFQIISQVWRPSKKKLWRPSSKVESLKTTFRFSLRENVSWKFSEKLEGPIFIWTIIAKLFIYLWFKFHGQSLWIPWKILPNYFNKAFVSLFSINFIWF